MAGCDMKLRQRLVMAAIASALLIAGCGEENPGTGGTSGAGGIAGAAGLAGLGGTSGTGGDAGVGGVGGVSGIGGSGDTGGSAGEPYQVCTLGLCLEDPELGVSCQQVYDACVGRGHYPRSCRMDADKTCGVFAQTGPY